MTDDLRKVDFLLALQGQYLEDQLRQVVSPKWFWILNNHCLIIAHIFTNITQSVPNFYFSFQGCDVRTLTPMEAVQVLHRCEKRTGKTIPKDELNHEGLSKWLKPEDFAAVQVRIYLF